MQTGKRVYPRQREPGKWLSYLLLFLSAVVVISGVVSRGGDLTIEPAATATPIPTDAYFDETVEEREITLHPPHGMRCSWALLKAKRPRRSWGSNS